MQLPVRLLKSCPRFLILTFFDWSTFAYLAIGASLIYAGGCTLNDAFDQNFDQAHNPKRPLPSGSISPKTVWILGSLELLFGVILMVTLAGCEKTWVLALVASVVLYDYIHKKWGGGILIMGACRFFLWIAAATAAGKADLAPQTWIWATVLAAYIIGVSWFARGESKKDKAPVQYSVILLFSSPLIALAFLVYWNQLDPIRVFLCNLTGLLVAWIAFSSVLLMREGEKRGHRNGCFSLTCRDLCLGCNRPFILCTKLNRTQSLLFIDRGFNAKEVCGDLIL